MRVTIAYPRERDRDLVWRISMTQNCDSSERAPSRCVTRTEYNRSGRIRRRGEMRYSRVVADEARGEPCDSRDRAEI